ncbi:hypothetical protein NMG60_11021858 [Bertholletia excelsa]
MEKQNQKRVMQQITRMFRSSFGSCKPRNLSDVVEPPHNRSRRHHHRHHQLIDLFSPRPYPFPSICKSKYLEPHPFTTHKPSNPCSLLSPVCPPGSPISPLNPQTSESNSRDIKQGKKGKKKKKKPTQFMTKDSFDSYYDGVSSEDDDDEETVSETTLFSSKSLSSVSSESSSKASHHHSRRGKMPHLQGKLKDSFAVVKRSSDPYNDFRTSMLEMIVQKQILSACELEQLLQTFLALNSYHHHRIIVEVFTEIWEALFIDCS